MSLERVTHLSRRRWRSMKSWVGYWECRGYAGYIIILRWQQTEIEEREARGSETRKQSIVTFRVWGMCYDLHGHLIRKISHTHRTKHQSGLKTPQLHSVSEKRRELILQTFFPFFKKMLSTFCYHKWRSLASRWVPAAVIIKRGCEWQKTQSDRDWNETWVEFFPVRKPCGCGRSQHPRPSRSKVRPLCAPSLSKPAYFNWNAEFQPGENLKVTVVPATRL